MGFDIELSISDLIALNVDQIMRELTLVSVKHKETLQDAGFSEAMAEQMAATLHSGLVTRLFVGIMQEG